MRTELQAKGPNENLLDRLCIILLAFCPILQHYKGLFINSAVTVLIVVFPYVLMKLMRKRILFLSDVKFVSTLILFFGFKVIDHGTTITEAGQAVIFSILVIAIASGCFDTKLFIRIVTIISATASVCIILQYICYYLLGRHIQMVPTSLLLAKSSQWVLGARTGRASITGRRIMFYRPSAFFLEPSHMFIYLFMPLALALLGDETETHNKKTAMLISAGMILSTSGMGILTAIGIWFVYFGQKRKNKQFSLLEFLKPKGLLLAAGSVLAFVVMFRYVPFFKSSILRIVGSGQDYKNAITGRVSAGNELVRSIHGVQRWFGVEDRLAGIEFNMSGFNATMYQYGVVGTVISYLFYLQGIFKIRHVYFWISLVIIALSFFSAHTHSTMFMIYAVFVFTEGYKRLQRPLMEKEINYGS